MPIEIYRFLHFTAIILMAAIAFQSYADPDESKKRKRMMLGGIAAFIAFVAGFGLLAKLELKLLDHGWAIVKLVCLIGIAALSGAVYRSPSKGAIFSYITAVLVAVAVYCAVYKPF